jgi:hypothetical protein
MRENIEKLARNAIQNPLDICTIPKLRHAIPRVFRIAEVKPETSLYAAHIV